jgi:hypothetical protein
MNWQKLRRIAFVSLALVLMAASVPSSSAQLAYIPWPMFHHDAQRTGRATAHGIFTVDDNWRWTFDTGFPVGPTESTSSPIVGEDGTIYYGSMGPVAPAGKPKLYAINPNGTERWRVETTDYGKISSSPAYTRYASELGGPRIYVATHESSGIRPNFFAIDALTGAKIWELTLPENDCVVFSSLALTNEWFGWPDTHSYTCIYFGSWNGYLYKIVDDLDHGTISWRTQISSYPILSSPAVSTTVFPFPPTHGTVYIGTLRGIGVGGELYAINLEDGSVKWHIVLTATLAEAVSSPAVDIVGGIQTVYVGTTDWRMCAIQDLGPNNPNLKWIYTTGGDVISCPAIYDLNGNGNVEIIFGSGDHYVYAVTDNCTPTPTLYWRYLTGGVVRSSAAIALAPQPTVFIGSDDNRIYSINWDLSTWSTWGVGSFTTGGAVCSSPAVAQPETDMVGVPGWVFVGSNDGKLYAFGPALLWRIYLPLIMKGL